jgi:hypothetical protein
MRLCLQSGEGISGKEEGRRGRGGEGEVQHCNPRVRASPCWVQKCIILPPTGECDVNTVYKIKLMKMHCDETELLTVQSFVPIYRLKGPVLH